MGVDQSIPGVTNAVAQTAATPVTATLQAAAGATGNGTVLNVTGMATAILTLSGTFVGTVNWEVTEDSGTTWTPTSPNQYNAGSTAPSTTATAPGLFQFPVAGLTGLRARISGWASGTITVTGHAVPLEFSHRGIIAGASENFIGAVGGKTVVAVAATMTRPADTTAYTSGDLVANSTTAGSVVPLQFTVARVALGSGMIRRVRLRKSGTGITNASFRLHLYAAAPGTVTNGDNGAWSTSGVADYLGSLDVTCDKAFTDGASGNGTPTNGSEINFALSSGQIVYGLLEARGAWTPTSGEVITAALETLQN